MQSCAQWIRSNIPEIPGISDEKLNAAGEPPSDSQYVRMDEVNSIVIHHSATETGCSKVFRALHRGVNGWIDIGYHYVIGNGSLSADGEIESGRPVWAVGAHTRWHNENSIGICLVGNFNNTAPTTMQMKALTGLLSKLMTEYDLSGSDIMLHRNAAGCNTECPGDKLAVRDILESL